MSGETGNTAAENRVALIGELAIAQRRAALAHERNQRDVSEGRSGAGVLTDSARELRLATQALYVACDDHEKQLVLESVEKEVESAAAESESAESAESTESSTTESTVAPESVTAESTKENESVAEESAGQNESAMAESTVANEPAVAADREDVQV